jgi:hypothetical protein
MVLSKEGDQNLNWYKRIGNPIPFLGDTEVATENSEKQIWRFQKTILLLHSKSNTMLITRVSILSGKTNTMDLDVTESQMEQFYRGEGYLHTIFPNLNSSEREFIKSGITPEEWDKMVGLMD